MPPNFETALKAEDEEIAWLRETPAFIVRRPVSPADALKPKTKWNAWNLIPSESEGYGPFLAGAWRIRMQCYEAAGSVPGEYARLMEQPYIEVIRMLLLQRAANY